MSTWITLSVVALLPMLLRVPKALTPLRVSSSDPTRFSGMSGDSYTSGSTSSTTTTTADSHTTSVTNSIGTTVVVTDRFFLTGSDGRVQSFEGTNFEARVGDGHLVSLAWVIRGRKKSGPYFLIYNHATDEVFFNDKAIQKAMTFPYPAIYIAILILMVLPFPVVIFFGLAEMVQMALFHRMGAKPLVASFQSGAKSLPVRAESAPPSSAAADIASALKEITALRDSGALSEAEFETAKTKLLAP